MRAIHERSFYRSAVEDCRRLVKARFSREGVPTIRPPGVAPPPGSGPDMVHYSFDFAQQIHYPLQPGPMCFKTARKCAVFGVCCEGIPRQINYLIDEASDIGKGGNTVVSLLHHFFRHHSLGESRVKLHADNCVGQNKNNTVSQVVQVCEMYAITTNTTTHMHTHTNTHTHTL